MPLPSLSLIYNEPRLRMTSGGRFLVRLTTVAIYALLVTADALLLLSDVPYARPSGILLALFLVHRLIRIGAADRSIDFLPAQGIVNVASYYTPAAYRLIEYTYEHSRLRVSDASLILLRRLTQREEAKAALRHLDIAPGDFIQKIDAHIEKNAEPIRSEAELLGFIETLAKNAFLYALTRRDRFILPRHLFAALEATGGNSLAKLWTLFDLKPDDLESALRFGVRIPHSPLARPRRMRHRMMNRAWTARPTPLLDEVSDDLTDLARATGQGHALIGHRDEFEQLLDVLARPGNQNTLLLGEAGSGRTAILEHLAHEIARDRVPAPLFDHRLVSLDVGALVAGTKEGDMELKLKRIVGEIVRAGNVILVIPDLHNLMKTSGTGRMSGADVLIPAIKSNVCDLIGTTTPQDFKKYLEPASEFTKNFEVVRVEEVSEDEALDLTIQVSAALEEEYRILVSFKAVREAVRLAKRFMRETPLPGSAVNLLREAFAEAVRKGEKTVAPDEVRAVAEREVKVPLHETKGEERDTLLNFESYIHARFVDQNEAVVEVARALREYRSGLSKTGGTIANFLFVGPTGVGKTELAKLVAEIQFGSPKLMLRFDMSEYSERGSVERLIGSARGAAGGTLTEAVRLHPYALILLDEFEKAHKDVLNLFLQVFDDGRLTDALGRTIRFENTILIATSNAHSDLIQAAVEKGETATSIAGYLKTKLTDYFKIELLNRFTDIIVFRNLSIADLKAIVKIQLKELVASLEAQGITITFDESVIDALAKWGYDPQFGARPLARAIDERVKGPLSEQMLKEEIKRGDAIVARIENEAVLFQQKNPT